MTSINDEEINKAILIIGELLDFIEKITVQINNKATGYEITFELENFREDNLKKIKELDDRKIKLSLVNVPRLLYYSKEYFKRIGGGIILDKINSKEYKEFIEDVRKTKLEAKREIGYLEFKKL